MLDRALDATPVGLAAVGIDIAVVTALPIIWLITVGDQSASSRSAIAAAKKRDASPPVTAR